MQARVTIDVGGGIAVPNALWQRLGVGANDDVMLLVTDEGILVRPVPAEEVEDYTEARIDEFACEQGAVAAVLARAADKR